ncbi:MAG: HprK-related kinase A [Alphaproteobacteria bacterium]
MPGELISSIAPADLKGLLARGATLQVPPFTVSVQTDNRALVAALTALYGNFPITRSDAVADFTIRVGSTGGFRRFFRRQAMAHIDTPPPYVPLPYEMAPLMFEQALNWCVATRTFSHLVMHAAVVAKDGKAVIIPGETGQGKSTLCAALVSKGWRHLSDEFALIDPDTLEITAHPRPISLKNASLEAVQAWDRDAEPKMVMHGTPKGSVGYLPPSRRAVEAASQRVTPAAIVFPGFGRSSDPSIREVGKGQAFIILTACCVNYRELGETGFTALSRLVDSLPVYMSVYTDTATSVALVESLDLET